ncbi:glutamine synthetase [Cyanobium sp. FGCU-52]|nr:glutamine synthetase [Cyanobium sp. FGCU52]
MSVPDSPRRVAVTFVNHAGAVLVKVVPGDRFAAAARLGVGFSPVSDAWRIDGLPDGDHPLAVPDGDLRLVADAEALRPLEPAAGWFWAPGDRHLRDGSAYAADQRSFCRAGRDALAAEGVAVTAGFEIEWLVADPGPRGEAAPALAGGPYGADRLVEGLDYAGALLDALDAAGLPWLQFHPEYGAAQFELSLAPGDPLEAADRLVLAKLLIQRVSRRFGWRASFSPLPEATRVGNGGHVHLSFTRQDVPLLQGGDGPGGLPPAGAGLLGALLEALPALMPIGCPLAVSYRRLAPSRWSAPFRAWGVENREAALRLVPTEGDGVDAHLELKTADLAANPYLLLGALQALVQDGLRNPQPLPDPVLGDPALLAEPPERLPLDLAAASAAFAASLPLRQAMGPLLHDTLVAGQQAEVRRAAALDPEELIASCRWLPLTG